jgi:hypothetical protein
MMIPEVNRSAEPIKDGNLDFLTCPDLEQEQYQENSLMSWLSLLGKGQSYQQQVFRVPLKRLSYNF